MLVETVADRPSEKVRGGTQRSPKPIRDLLVIAGLSGSGKTTFMMELAAGQLPKGIQNLLPPGVEAWPQGFPHELSNLVHGRSKHELRYVMHYDIAVPIRDDRVKDYGSDPALSLLSCADRVGIVFIKPTLQQLRAHSRRRVYGGRSRLENGVNFLCFKSLSLNAALQKACGRLTKPRRQMLKVQRKQQKFFPTSQWLLWMYRWEHYIRKAQATRRVDYMVVLEPSSDVYSDDRRWRQIDLAGIYAELSQRIKQVRRVARIMDDQFTVPGTNIRFGWDAIIGLVPGIGDVLTSVVSLVIVHHAWRLGTPFFVLVRMLGNIGVDLVLGSVPILGDAFDVVWKANSKNARLLEQHSEQATLVTC